MAKGEDIVKILMDHEGDEYIFGALTPVGAEDPHVFDCSKFVSWGVYQASKIIYGCENDDGDPMSQYGGTIYWGRDVKTKGKAISIEQAAGIPGAALLRLASGSEYGHIVVSQGNGKTIEAASHSLGVVQLSVHNRRWTTGVLVPGIQYDTSYSPVPVTPHGVVYHIGMTDPAIAKIQEFLKVTPASGIFGPKTEQAVMNFQKNYVDPAGKLHLIVDGEVGPLTLQAMGITV